MRKTYCSYSIVSSHFCRHPSVPLLMCLECALEKSSVQVTAVASEFAEIDDFLDTWCKRREPVPGDGHCIVYSWIKVNIITVLVYIFVFPLWRPWTWKSSIFFCPIPILLFEFEVIFRGKFRGHSYCRTIMKLLVSSLNSGVKTRGICRRSLHKILCNNCLHLLVIVVGHWWKTLIRTW